MRLRFGGEGPRASGFCCRGPGSAEAALGGAVHSSRAQLRGPEGQGPRLSVRGILCFLPSRLAPTEPNTGSHCAELGQRPRHKGRHVMSPGAQTSARRPSWPSNPLRGAAPFQPASPRVPAGPPSITPIWLGFRARLEEAHSSHSGAYRPPQRGCRKLRTCCRLRSLECVCLSD